MADTLPGLSNTLTSDPDAQATVTDFLDYTEFFPSDLFRSLTLIGKLDEIYQQDTAKVHQLTKTYGALPTLPVVNRPAPQQLRNDISTVLDHAIRCRESTYAEATRLCNAADNLHSRLVGIRKKLQALPKPPSRDPTPVPRTRSPVASRVRKPDPERTPRITLFPDGGRNATQARGHNPTRPRHRNHRIIVPGEVLPPFDPNSPGPSVDSDSESERPSSPAAPPIRLPEKMQHEKTLKIPKTTSIKLPKISTRIRPPGVMGTNVHSAVAGISVSNAMAYLSQPPPNPPPGSRYAPWLKLTEWELNKLRKRMKKNADWVPSDTMVRRELAENGRGLENYHKARLVAENGGDELVDEEPEAFVRPVTYRGQPATLELHPDTIESLENRGMKLNQAKKLKRNIQLMEQAAREGGELVGETGVMADSAESFKGLVIKYHDTPHAEPIPQADIKPVKKRKRETSSEAVSSVIDPALMGIDDGGAKPGPKKIKLGLPASTNAGKIILEAPSSDKVDSQNSTDSIPLALTRQTGLTVPVKDEVPAIDSPLLPPSQAPGAGDSKVPRTTTRSNRASAPSTKPSTPTPESRTVPEPTTNLAGNRPRPRAPGVISLSLAKKAASAEPPARRSSGRRTSNASLPSTHAGTPVVPKSAAVVSSRRGKRPAPGVLTSHDGAGGLQIILGKRKAAPGRKRSTTGKKFKPEATPQTPVDEEEVDPDEQRYCLCGGVSSGKMIACDGACEKEWFHLECVGLVDVNIPGRRTDWYCPECRVKLKVGEHGEPVGKPNGRK